MRVFRERPTFYYQGGELRAGYTSHYRVDEGGGSELAIKKGIGVPVWRMNPPTEPGLYWFKLRVSEEYPPKGVLRFCQVIKGGDGSLILGCRNFDSDHFQRVEILQRWWAGPLLEPDDG